MNENILKHIGEKHGIYTIIDVLPQPDKYGHYQYKCICNECGYVKYTHHGSVAGPNHVITKCNHLRSDGNFKVKRKIFLSVFAVEASSILSVVTYPLP